MALIVLMSGCAVTTPPGGWKHGESPGDTGKETDTQVAPLPVETIRKAQYRLTALGYDPGPVDGVLGKKTEIAIKHFQVDEEIDIDGVLTQDLIARLDRAAEELRSGANQSRSSADRAISQLAAQAKPGPIYEAGDIYIYSDGAVETVARVGPDQATWETADGTVRTAHRNFILPPISWKQNTSSGENQILPGQGEKWPAAARGGKVSFAVGSKAAGANTQATANWSGKWHCSIAGTAKVATVIGRFEALTLQCDRNRPKPGEWKRRTWYYVPKIGHYVRRTDTLYGSGHVKTVDLVAILPSSKGWPTAAVGGLDWAIQSALDAGRKAEPVEWKSSAVGATFHIRVFGREDKLLPGGTICRRYIIERTDADQHRDFPAVACKHLGQDRWLIPGIDPESPSPLAIPRQ